MVGLIKIGDRLVGPDAPCFIIAEAGVNHNGSLEMALRLIDVAADAGADAIKFQTFTAEKLLLSNAPKAAYQMETTNPTESQAEMLKRLELSAADFAQLNAKARDRKIIFLSTPFDEEAADLLQQIDLAAFKIPSGEITNMPLLAHIARKGRPMLISTGMADLAEVGAAVTCARENGCEKIVVLQCVSNYPALPADVNLRAMKTMASSLDVPVGYSDHADGIALSLAAVALGACVLEKHLTLDRSLPGPDHRASLEPAELAQLVREVRAVEAALGHGRKEPAASEAGVAMVARRSLVAACAITADSVITDEMLGLRRPGTGLPPSKRSELLGRKARVAIPAGTLLRQEMFA